MNLLPPPIPPVGMESAVTPLTVAREGMKRQLQSTSSYCELLTWYHLHKATSSPLLLASNLFSLELTRIHSPSCQTLWRQGWRRGGVACSCAVTSWTPNWWSGAQEVLNNRSTATGWRSASVSLLRSTSWCLPLCWDLVVTRCAKSDVSVLVWKSNTMKIISYTQEQW